MKVQPLGDRVLVKMLAAEEKTASGIIIPATAQEKTNHGEVCAIGSSTDIQVKVGEKVMYDKYAGTQIKIDGDDYIIASMKDILATIN